MRSGCFFLTVFVSMSVLPAQQVPLGGAIEGFTFDFPTKSVRPVIGTLGSATLGEPVFRGLAYGSVAPHQNFALAFQDRHCSLLSGLGSLQAAQVRVPGEFGVPDGVAWSGDGSTAVLYSRSGSWIQTISGLPTAMNAGVPLSVASLGGSLSAAAVDLHGDRVAIGITGADSGVYQIAEGPNFVPLLPFLKPSALAFSEDGATLYALDRAANQLFAQNTADHSYEFWPLDGLIDPVAIRPAHDAANRALVYVAGHNDQSLVAYDTSSHQVLGSVPLGFQPNVIEVLGAGSFLLVSRASTNDILWSFRNTPQPIVYFVPALPLRGPESRRK